MEFSKCRKASVNTFKKISSNLVTLIWFIYDNSEIEKDKIARFQLSVINRKDGKKQHINYSQEKPHFEFDYLTYYWHPVEANVLIVDSGLYLDMMLAEEHCIY